MTLSTSELVQRLAPKKTLQEKLSFYESLSAVDYREPGMADRMWTTLTEFYGLEEVKVARAMARSIYNQRKKDSLDPYDLWVLSSKLLKSPGFASNMKSLEKEYNNLTLRELGV